MLEGALRSVAEALSTSQDPWWIIGSVAVALHGGDPGKIADIDVITSRHDLDDLYARLPLSSTPDITKSMFRSKRFGVWAEPELPVEFMAGLEGQKDGKWHPVQPQTRPAISLGEHTLYVPEKAELIAILRQFGRDKDLARAATLAGD